MPSKRKSPARAEETIGLSAETTSAAAGPAAAKAKAPARRSRATQKAASTDAPAAAPAAPRSRSGRRAAAVAKPVPAIAVIPASEAAPELPTAAPECVVVVAPETPSETRNVAIASSSDTPNARGLGTDRVVSRDERHQMIARLAYGYAERSGFSTDPFLNWLSAERDVDRMIKSTLN